MPALGKSRPDLSLIEKPDTKNLEGHHHCQYAALSPVVTKQHLDLALRSGLAGQDEKVTGRT